MVNDINYKTNLIMEIQNYLINVKNLYTTLPTVYPTGIYDEATRDAVFIFQNIKGIQETGLIDICTLNELVRENNEYIGRTQMPGRIPVGTHSFVDVKPGDKKDIVYAIKVMVNSFCRKYINCTELEITNLYDTETEEALRLFQQRSMLPATGIVDINTWNTLVKVYETSRLYREMPL